MLTLSHQNHFKFGYNGNWFAARSAPEDEWCVAYGRSTWLPGDWRSECIKTARLIRDEAEGALWILFSGGIDSEVVIQSFMFAGIPFNVAITRFDKGLNRHDVVHAVRFCEMHGVRYRFLDIDIEAFFESGNAWAYAMQAKCVQPQLLHTMWAMDQLNGYPILGSGECYLVRRESRDPVTFEDGFIWEMQEKERIASWYRHLIAANRPGCAGFFQYNPENMLAFLSDSQIENLCTNKMDGYSSTMKLKEHVYRRYFLLESRRKFHGFESVMHLDGRLRPQLEAEFGDHDGIVCTSYARLLEGLVP